jgi:hypothetical protein
MEVVQVDKEKKNTELNFDTPINPDYQSYMPEKDGRYTSVEFKEAFHGESVDELRAIEEGNIYFAGKEIGQQNENG